ncbi:hypothetical protein Tco_0902979, partial [Tanacetum coccineum]
LVPNTVAPQTRSNPAVTDEILAGLRDPVAQMMREEMEKLTDEMRANAMEAITSTLVINQGDQRQTIQFTRAPRLSFQNLVVRMLTGGCTSFMRLIGDILPWLVFRGAVMQRFGNPIDDPLAELKNYKFETSVKDYQNAYDKLLSRVDISEDQAISFYMAGLPTDVELAVRMFKPQTPANAYSLSKLQFTANYTIKKKNKTPFLLVPRFNTYSSGTTINSPKPLALRAPNANWRNKPSTSQNAPLRRRLTKKELEEKRSKNQCFYCD